MDYQIFNVRAHVNACDCTRGCANTSGESALKADSGKKNPLPHWGIEPALAACRSDALPAELHPISLLQSDRGSVTFQLRSTHRSLATVKVRVLLRGQVIFTRRRRIAVKEVEISVRAVLRKHVSMSRGWLSMTLKCSM